MSREGGSSFPPGLPILVLVLVAALAWLLQFFVSRSEQNADDLRLWIFATSHRDTYLLPIPGTGDPPLVDSFKARYGRGVRIELTHVRALDTRLLSLFQSDARGEKLPDVVKIEIGSVGKFLRVPADDVQFLPLNGFFERDGLMEKMVTARLAPWMRDGQIFGVPHDVHPVTLTYRHDLWTEAGIDLESVVTWSDFAEAAKRYREYWRGRGHPERVALELTPSAPGDLITLLLQRDLNIVDQSLSVHLNDARVIDTVAHYARWVAGRDRFAGPTSSGGNNWVNDLERGDVGALLTPDWRVSYIRTVSRGLENKLRMRALPVFEPGGRPTSTAGGTMVAIPRHARDPEASWQLIKHLLFTPEGLEARRVRSDILPPQRDAWLHPAYDSPDIIYGGLATQRFFANLADLVPERHATAYSALAAGRLSLALLDATRAVEQDASDEQLRSIIQASLDRAQREVETQINFQRIDKVDPEVRADDAVEDSSSGESTHAKVDIRSEGDLP